VNVRLAILRVHVSVAASLAPLLVRSMPLRPLVRWLAARRRARPYAGIPAVEIERAIDRRLRNPRMMVRRACLRRGLLLLHFLNLAGIPAEIRFGVYAPRSDSERMHGYCYVVADGIGEEEPPEETLTVLWTERA